jgi:hypothetical protein
MYFGDTTFFLLLPAIVLALFAQTRVRSTFRRFSRVRTASGMTGADAARNILNTGGAGDVAVERVGGTLTDHYDPRKKILRLSTDVHDSNSVAALGIAAHEAGHALQHHEHFAPLSFRNAIFPVVNIGSNLAFPLFFIGLFTASRGPSLLMDIGIFLFCGAVLFSVVTLPVEFNASKRAIVQLRDRGYLSPNELAGAKSVLSAAALTYIASTAMAVLQLVRMIMLRDRRT